MATTKGVVLEKSWGFTKAEARETLASLRRVGLIPEDVRVEFITCGSSEGFYFGSRAGVSRTAGQRFAFRERQALR